MELRANSNGNLSFQQIITYSRQILTVATRRNRSEWPSKSRFKVIVYQRSPKFIRWFTKNLERFKTKINELRKKQVIDPQTKKPTTYDQLLRKTYAKGFGKNTSYLYILNADHIYEALCKVPKVDSY